MKKPLFYIAIVFVLSSLSISCTTDSYDRDMEESVLQADNTTSDTTDPIIIPKKD